MPVSPRVVLQVNNLGRVVGVKTNCGTELEVVVTYGDGDFSRESQGVPYDAKIDNQVTVN